MSVRERLKAATTEIERQRRQAAADTRHRDRYSELARGVADDHIEAIRTMVRWVGWVEIGAATQEELRAAFKRELAGAERRHELLDRGEVDADVERLDLEVLEIANRPAREGR